MLNCARLERHPRVFQSLTGLSQAAFAQLLPAFERAYLAALDAADAQRASPRERQRGGGRTATLATLGDKLVFIQFYLRMYPAQEAQGFFFGLSQGQACTWIHRPSRTSSSRTRGPGRSRLWAPPVKARNTIKPPSMRPTFSSQRAVGSGKIPASFDDLVISAACGLHNLRLVFRLQVA
jgi:hypothetical protein